MDKTWTNARPDRLISLFSSLLALLFLVAACSTTNEAGQSQDSPDGQTDISDSLNSAMSPDSEGVIVRAPDGLTTKLRPATLLRNDSFAPTQMYVDPPQCPNDGTDGYDTDSGFLNFCNSDDAGDPYKEAVVGAAIGTKVDKYDAGVYYPTDSNSVDKRCYFDGNNYKCPDEKGNGGPADFDGTGCHAGDQTDAPSPDGVKLVSSPSCECNVDLSGNDWNDWIDHWIQYAADSDNGTPWFKGNDPSIPYYQPGGEKGKAPAFAMDEASCWTKDKGTMIDLQNAFWRNRAKWWNGTVPRPPEAVRNFDDQEGMKYYWGWNEVLARGDIDDNTDDWDSIVATLPAGLDSISDLSEDAHRKLEKDLLQFSKENNLSLGSPQTAYILVLKETYQEGDTTNPDQWQRSFFCEAFDFSSVGGSLKINSLSTEDPESDGKGACWLSDGASNQ